MNGAGVVVAAGDVAGVVGGDIERVVRSGKVDRGEPTLPENKAVGDVSTQRQSNPIARGFLQVAVSKAPAHSNEIQDSS